MKITYKNPLLKSIFYYIKDSKLHISILINIIYSMILLLLLNYEFLPNKKLLNVFMANFILIIFITCMYQAWFIIFNLVLYIKINFINRKNITINLNKGILVVPNVFSLVSYKLSTIDDLKVNQYKSRIIISGKQMGSVSILNEAFQSMDEKLSFIELIEHKGVEKL